MKIEKIKEKLNPLLTPHDLSIYSMKTKREFGEQILEILIDGQGIHSDLLESIHLKLIDQLSDDELEPNFFLELSSVGVERPLVTQEDFHNAVGKYIYLESSEYKGNATLLSYESGVLELQVNEKGRIRKIKIEEKNARKTRLAVKF
ncbi:MAG: hypothetical protein IH571_01880 [Acholeplasmataceae bacterium]|nr:hypothetical protein [Acholeplasmataceae bacterium]